MALYFLGEKKMHHNRCVMHIYVVPVGLEPTTHSLRGRLLLPTERRNLTYLRVSGGSDGRVPRIP